MADTLRSLAGSTFRATDVISLMQAPLTPEQRVLNRYVFLPHARTGIAAALSRPFAWGGPAQASAEIKVPVIDDRGALDAQMTVHVHGPADVTEIDTRQVIRAFPKVDAPDAEVDDLAHVEFDRPDLPWLFTPAGMDGAGRLVPWITLVVAERRFVEWGEQRGATRRAKIRRDQLQPLHDAWAWAHAQVMGAKSADPAAEPTLERRLGEANASQNLSRLVCPRRLDDHSHYVACVVPTFLCGAQAGLGLTPSPTLEPAWGTAGTAADFAAGDPASMVELPVYYSWSFGTGEDGNFESLARKLKPAVAPPGVGRRRVDATRPWPGRELAAGDPGAEIVVTGPVVSPQKPEDSPAEQWPTEAQQQWAPEVAKELVSKLNNADVQAHVANPGPPLVGPPLYGANHARQPRIETEQPAAGAQPRWFGELNTDPRDRIVGGLGTRVVQAEQEDLMTAAWNQVIGVEAANRALRLAQFAKHVSASLHRRHLSRLADGTVVSMTERVHAKVLDAPQRSVWATLEDSSLPTSVTVGAFRRLTRVRGPVVRVAVKAAADRALAVQGLTVRADRMTTDWVRTYASPDGVAGIGDLARKRLTDDVAARIAPGVGGERLLASWDDELSRPAPSDQLTPEALARARPPRAVDVGPQLAGALLRRVLATTPGARELDDDRQAAVTAAAHGMLLRSIIEAAGDAGVELPRADAKRLRLDGSPTDDRLRVKIGPDALRSFSEQAIENVRRLQIEDVPFDEFERDGEQLRDLLDSSARLSGRAVLGGLQEIAGRIVTGEDAFADIARDRVDAPALAIVKKLDPGVTVPARVHARLTAGSGRLPKWLKPGWFDDLRVEPVMAHPRFRHPMYEALHRYDREWMIPGLGLIKRPDMATLLQTNNRFIEGYLVGLNHEMGRELLWREYPTDQRGTYFDSFWTGQRELVADMHEPAWRGGELRSHVHPALDGRLVFLVRGDLIRRYPGVVAHAAREASTDRGIPIFEAASPIRTLFQVQLTPNVLLVGFDMERERIDTPGEEWWFTLSENPSEPRFGLDPSRPGALERERDNLIWNDFGVTQPGGFLDAAQHTAISVDGPPFDPPSNPPFERSQWGATSAEVAYLLFQLPARAAFSAKKMVAGAMP